MDIFVYSDESGVFDEKHYEHYVFGGLIFLCKQDKDLAERKYSEVETNVRQRLSKNNIEEIKGSNLSNKYKTNIFRSMNNWIKFGVVIDLKKVNKNIYQEKNLSKGI